MKNHPVAAVQTNDDRANRDKNGNPKGTCYQNNPLNVLQPNPDVDDLKDVTNKQAGG